MRGRAVATGSEGEFARPRSGERDQIFRSTRRKCWMHDQDIRCHRHQCNRCKVLDRVVGQLCVEACVHCMRTGIGHDQRVTIGCRFGGSLRADNTARAGLVIDDDGLAKRFVQLLADRARHDIGAAARCRWHDDAYGFDRISGVLLRQRSGGANEQHCKETGR